jgi:hypothetical protein
MHNAVVSELKAITLFLRNVWKYSVIDSASSIPYYINKGILCTIYYVRGISTDVLKNLSKTLTSYCPFCSWKPLAGMRRGG